MIKKRLKMFIVVFVAIVCFSSFLFINKASANQLPDVDWISITRKPSKTEYSKGEELDLSDMILEGFYFDGSKITLKDYEVSNYNPNQLGSQYIVIEYQGKSVYLEISVLPARVQNISIAHQDAKSVTLKWDAIICNRYEVYAMDNATGLYNLEAITYDNSITLSTSFGETRNYQVRAIDYMYGNEYKGYLSEPFTVATKPGAVTGLKFVDNTATAIAISWDEIPEATGYIVYRSLATADDYSYCGRTDKTYYTDKGLVAGRNYKYKVSAYVLNETFEGDLSRELEAYTNLNNTKLNYKPGDKKVRLTWTKVANATSYDLFIQEGESEVTFLTAIEGNANNSYIVEGLSIGENYYFYVMPKRQYNNVIYDGPISNVVQVILDEIANTSTDAKLFANEEAFQGSSAYLEIDFFRENVDYEKSFPLPGLITTNVEGFSSTRMCPQGISFAGDYILLTAYDMAKEENSVIYVVHKDTKELLTTLVLSDKHHVGGISFDGVNVWISSGSRVSSILFSDVEAAAKMGEEYSLIQYDTTSAALGIPASYITYYDDKLWVGAYNELQSTRMYSYVIENKDNKPTLVKQDTIIMPTRVQGVAFTSNGELIMSRSCQLYLGLRGYMRQIDVYKPAYDMKTDGIIPLGESVKTVEMPSMGEGIAIDGSHLYVSFESAAFDAASYKMDRVCAFSISAILPVEY
ncbi:MAG: hypothetical protein GX271_09740 [Clostridiales bacterium]|nr:hypothetical protein [Clostridiales bacterium]